KLMIITLVFASIVAFFFYTVPDWVFLEIPIRDLVQFFLSLLGITTESIPNNGQSIIPMNLRGGPFPFLEATEKTPGIYIPLTNGRYYISKTCTAMQAYALLFSIILVAESSKIAKIRAIIVTFIVLFFLNALRVTFHLWSVTILNQIFHVDLEIAFFWAHDVSSKIIGFLGTILLAFLIEKMGVPLIECFADWLDYLWWRGNSILEKIVGK
ncbi:MAG: hypothetical protein JSV04_04620, partial [Candidatus Heimdallarchaeota archaeon]